MEKNSRLLAMTWDYPGGGGCAQSDKAGDPGSIWDARVSHVVGNLAETVSDDGDKAGDGECLRSRRASVCAVQNSSAA